MYYDKEWGNLTSKEKQEIKKAHGGAGTGAKKKWKEAKERANNRQEQSKDWGDGNTLTGPINNPETPKPGQSPAAPKPTPAPTQPTPAPSTPPASKENPPTPEELGMKYKDENYYKAIGVETPAMKSEKAVQPPPERQTFDNPHSAEAIAYRQQRSKNLANQGKGPGVYDTSVNEGYDQNLTPGQELKQWHMDKAYKQEMEKQGLNWDSAGGYHNYKFDMTKGYYVPNEATRQQRASMYDNMYMRGGSDRAKLGDRHSYIHKFFDPLNGAFQYDNTYDIE